MKVKQLFRCRAISKENKQYKLTIQTQEKMLESQDFVMTNLRNGIDYLKASCKNAGENIPETIFRKTVMLLRRSSDEWMPVVKLDPMVSVQQDLWRRDEDEDQGEVAWCGYL